jgi:hypothetical protein
MDRDRLEAYLSEGMSLPQIGRLTGRDPSTVGYWVAKHGLVANGKAKYAPRGALTREQLEPLVEAGASVRQIAEAVDRSDRTVRYWIDRLGLTVPKRVRRTRITNPTAATPRVLQLQCRRHGATDFVLEGRGYYRCRRCRIESVSEWRRRVKLRLIEEFGGSCQLCGYDRCPAALEFHHLDPREKEFSVSRQGATRSYAEVRGEAKKCALLCGNCHAEVEVGFRTLECFDQLSIGF